MGVWDLLTARYLSCLSLSRNLFNCLLPVLSLSLSFSLTCHVNTLVRTVLLRSNKCNNINNNNIEITPFILVLAGRNLHMSQTPSHQRQDTWRTNWLSIWRQQSASSGFQFHNRVLDIWLFLYITFSVYIRKLLYSTYTMWLEENLITVKLSS